MPNTAYIFKPFHELLKRLETPIHILYLHPKPTTEPQAQRMTIRVPAMAGNRGIALARGEPETTPPNYTEQVDLDRGKSPKVKEERLSPEPERAQQTRLEGSGEASRVEPTSGGEESRVLDDPDVVQGTISNMPGFTERTNASENMVAVRQNEPRWVQVTLDPEIAETIRRRPGSNKAFERKSKAYVERHLRYAPWLRRTSPG